MLDRARFYHCTVKQWVFILREEISLKWNEEAHNYLIELKTSGNYTWKQIAEKMTERFPYRYTDEQCRARWRTNKHKIKINPKETYGTKIKRHEDGTIEVDQLIEISKEKLKDDKYILEAHGYDDNWEIISHQFSMWNHHNKQDGTKTLYASKIRVKPKEEKLTTDELIKIITSETEPIKTNSFKYKLKDKRMLEISLMDMHFGVNTLDDYQNTLARITYHLEKRIWDEVLITFGSDLMHVDNLKNTTANGTRIQDVDVKRMIEDVKTFYEYLVNKAIKQSNKVKVYYIKGNHDETTSGLLVHWLQARFPNIEVDTSIEEVKVHTWEQIFVALTHGDKGGKRTKNALATKYPTEWANAKIREFHKGHTHHEQTKDEFGITERVLPTGAKVDQYHKDNSYDSAHKRFMIFEYSGDWLESIHYV